MTEDVKKDEVVQEDVQKEAPQLSEVEQKALEMGWRPKEEFEGDEVDFIDAKEFVQRQPLFDKIAAQSKQLKNLDKALHALQQHYTKVNETAYKKALADIKAQQEKAVEEGDLNTYHALNQKREEIEEEKEQLQTDFIPEPEPQVHPTMQAWVARNSWYESQPHMRVFAEEVGARFKGALMAKTITPEDVLKEVEKAVRAEFPQKFRNPNKDKAPAVEGAPAVKAGRKEAEPELTEVERNIMNTLVRQKVLTKEQYLADLKAAKAKG